MEAAFVGLTAVSSGLGSGLPGLLDDGVGLLDPLTHLLAPGQSLAGQIGLHQQPGIVAPSPIYPTAVDVRHCDFHEVDA